MSYYFEWFLLICLTIKLSDSDQIADNISELRRQILNSEKFQSGWGIGLQSLLRGFIDILGYSYGRIEVAQFASVCLMVTQDDS